MTDQNFEGAVREAVSMLRSGGLIIFPTETTYGAGVDACNQSAINKLLTYKSRREGKPLSIAVTDQEMATRYVELNDQARVLYHQFLPGPVTIVSKGRGVVAKGVESEFGTLGVRIPDYPLVIELVKQLDRPITATSANGSGKKRPYSVEDVLSRLSAKQHAQIDLILDAGRLPNRPPSTVIDTTLSTPITLRQGIIKLNTTETTTVHTHSEAETKRLAGQLLLKQWDAVNTGPIVLALDGPLGSGKTIFAQGVAEFLGISGPIVSPTYTYNEEYAFIRHQTKGTLYHLDMWKVDTQAQFERLEFAHLLKPKTVIVIEWWQQIERFVRSLLVTKNHVLLELTLNDEAQGTHRTIQFPT